MRDALLSWHLAQLAPTVMVIYRCKARHVFLVPADHLRCNFRGSQLDQEGKGCAMVV